jgi:thiol-disulfide isomerase/thioredoxin
MTDTTSESEHGTDPAQGQPPPGEEGRRKKVSTERSLLLTALVAALAAVALWAVLFRPSGSVTPPDNTTFSQLQFVTEDGRTATLSDYEGQPLVVNFFASWCAPCRAEMPDIEAAYRATNGRVAFVGVNGDLTEKDWHSFVAESQVTYPTVFQPNNDIFEALNLIGMPSTVLVNPDGTIAYRHSGLVDQDKLQQLITEHLRVEL